jgi:hypothetical protein
METINVEIKSSIIQVLVKIKTKTALMPSDGNDNAAAAIKKQALDQKLNDKVPRTSNAAVLVRALTNLLIGGGMLLILCKSFKWVKEYENVRIIIAVWICIFPVQTLGSNDFRPHVSQQQPYVNGGFKVPLQLLKSQMGCDIDIRSAENFRIDEILQHFYNKKALAGFCLFL